MHVLVNHLIQLQELTLIRDEQKVTAPGADHLQQLDASIAGMTGELPVDTRTLFLKLHKRDHIVISPISDGICAICGMRLPISLVQAVRLAREIHSCPNCARMLYCADLAPRRIGKSPRRTDPRKVGIVRFSSEALMVPRLDAAEKEGVIRELAYKMEHEGFVVHADKLVEEALRREAILSTAVDHGIAFPHVRGVEGGGLTLAMGLSPKGVDFGDKKDNLTKIVFLIVIPTAASAFYLKLLAGLTETLMKAENRKALLAEKEPDKLWKTLAKVTRATIK
jgi:mannitol/fructose-specific phosphotransferase system IIA component (Ntr-type)